MTKKVSTLLLIDGNSLFHRAYHALPPITDKSGEMANAVFGFSNMLIKAIGEVKPDYIACAFDTAAPTFRHVEFEKYKAQRKKPPEDLYPQLPKVKKVLDAFGIAYFEKEGYEADDLIATLASQAMRNTTKAKRLKHEKKALNVSRSSLGIIILSGDRDVLQLVDGNVKVQAPGWNLAETTLYGAVEVKKKFGITPVQMVDYKSLMGDASDNIGGIAGVGPKTASTLLQRYKNLENLYKHINEVEGSVKDKLEAGKDDALAAKKLVELDRDVDLPPASPAKRGEFTINDLRFDPDWDRVRNEYKSLGFKSIVAKIPGNDEKEESNVDKQDSQSQLELV
ncbi:hypothetical protein A3D04_05155 [Candidatus Curtissbacteria bacterium RIFCSPHIGHO2_02_FULL_40_16b]|uniref:5'-3' exonuclease domain-containing protein n=1 Tax=Candidatus Curtissbacteria bacterium RIFCSPHIGHO2_02_FULL_40_16b TaxID=1797714 RepID=A0A1F5G9I4_9BACT|nr:MAG: hypothetical protein A3D04_05155 [Candidatus Curtissbacteria bacterium RIFCSPHIGHO2_02_FULL_40_16b]